MVTLSNIYVNCGSCLDMIPGMINNVYWYSVAFLYCNLIVNILTGGGCHLLEE